MPSTPSSCASEASNKLEYENFDVVNTGAPDTNVDAALLSPKDRQTCECLPRMEASTYNYIQTPTRMVFNIQSETWAFCDPNMVGSEKILDSVRANSERNNTFRGAFRLASSIYCRILPLQ